MKEVSVGLWKKGRAKSLGHKVQEESGSEHTVEEPRVLKPGWDLEGRVGGEQAGQLDEEMDMHWELAHEGHSRPVTTASQVIRNLT